MTGVRRSSYYKLADKTKWIIFPAVFYELETWSPTLRGNTMMVKNAAFLDAVWLL
jgi:hypothetical protein